MLPQRTASARFLLRPAIWAALPPVFCFAPRRSVSGVAAAATRPLLAPQEKGAPTASALPAHITALWAAAGAAAQSDPAAAAVRAVPLPAWRYVDALHSRIQQEEAAAAAAFADPADDAPDAPPPSAAAATATAVPATAVDAKTKRPPPRTQPGGRGPSSAAAAAPPPDAPPARRRGPAVLTASAAWLRAYREDADAARSAGPFLSQLRDAVALRDAAAVSGDDGMRALADDEIAALASALGASGAAGDVGRAVRRRAARGDAFASAGDSWMLETIARAGGEEAAIFASELSAMFRAYAAENGWRVTDMTGVSSAAAASASPGGGDTAAAEGAFGSLPSFRLRIEGPGVYAAMRWEVGVHRVQRVPVTESSGRLQTSTASVLLLPLVDPVSVDIRIEDCDVEMMRGSGPGGQGVNSSSNCARVTHRPTGLTARCHHSRSGNENRDLALQMIAQRIWEQRAADRRSQGGVAFAAQWSGGERSDKMRTYNGPQNRVTDHRLGGLPGAKDFLYPAFLSGACSGGLAEVHAMLSGREEDRTFAATVEDHIERGFPIDE